MKKLILGLVSAILLSPLISEGAERIVSLGGTMTEIIYDLGQGDKIVGVDATSIYPESVEKKAQLGFYRNVSAEGVLSLKPDLVIMGESTQSPQLLKQLQGSNVKLVVIPEENSLKGIEEKIAAVGNAIGASKEAKSLVAKYKRDLESAKEAPGLSKPVRAMFLYARGPNTIMVAGGDTPAHVMMVEAGLENAFASVQGFKPVSAEAMVAANPELVLVQDLGFENVENSVWKMPGIELTTAGKGKKVILVRTLPFLGFGPRTGEELGRLKAEVRKQVGDTQN